MTGRKLGGPFGDELIAGSFLQRFTIFSFFIFPLFFKKNFQKYSTFFIPLLFIVFFYCNYSIRKQNAVNTLRIHTFFNFSFSETN